MLPALRVLLPLSLLLAMVPSAVAESSAAEEVVVVHCALPTSVECILDWAGWVGSRDFFNYVCAVGHAFLSDIPEECIH